MLVKIETLEKGDEVLIAANAEFRRLRLTRTPKVNPKRQWGRYSTVMCDILDAGDLSNYDVIRTMYQDLNYRQIWLIKKATE
jgi:hypothetical protein